MHPSELKDNNNEPDVSVASSARAVGATDKVSGAHPGRATSVIPVSPVACSGAGGSPASSTSIVSSAATSGPSHGLLLGPSSVGLLFRKKDIPVSDLRR